MPLWLCWLAAAALLPFHAHHHVVPAAGWLAPVFLLRWSRREPPRLRAWGGVVAAIALGDLLAFQGGYFPFPAAALPAIALVSGIVWSVPYALDRWTHDRLPPTLATLVFPAAMAALDGVNARFSPLGAWGSPAYAQAPDGALAQIAALTGLAGVTFVVHWLAPVLEGWWDRRALRPLVVFATVLGLVLGAGLLRLRRPASRVLRVAAVAASAERYADAWRGLRVPRVARLGADERAAFRPQFERNLAPLFARTAEAAEAGARVVAWPESVPVLAEDLEGFLTRARALADARDLFLVVTPEVVLRSAALPFARNLSILFDPDGRELWRYDKAHPVQGIEDGRLRPGAGAVPVVDTAVGRLATAICFDLDFGGIVHQAGRQQADLLIAPADDWPAIRAMHPRMAAFRAVENGFALLRPASQGVSVAIDPHGRAVAQASSLEGGDGFFVTDLPLRSGPPPLAPEGADALVATLLAGLLGLLAAARRRRAV